MGYRITNNYRRKIRLTGHGYRYSLVRKALQRNEILANRNVQSDICIETNTPEEQFILHLPGRKTVRINTIEELLENFEE